MEIKIGRFRGSALQVWWGEEESNSRSCYSNTFYASSNLDISISRYIGLCLLLLIGILLSCDTYNIYPVWTFGWQFSCSWCGEQRRGVRPERCYWNLCQGQGLWLSNLSGITMIINVQYHMKWIRRIVKTGGCWKNRKRFRNVSVLSLLWKSCHNIMNQE